MFATSNLLAVPAYENYQLSQKGMQNAMTQISSGDKLSRPGDGPTEWSLSQNFRYQITRSLAAQGVMANASNMVQTTDTWLQNTQNILSRMSELAVSASDGSKNQSDLGNLNTEYLQLKQELMRISRQAKYNGLQIAGRDQILSYNADKQTFTFSQINGTENYSLPVKVTTGLSSVNNVAYLFSGNTPFAQSQDGQYIFYVDSNNNLSRYTIEDNTLVKDTSDSNKKNISVDAQGSLWVSTETAPGSGAYALSRQDIGSWTKDTSVLPGPGISDIDSAQVSVYQGRVYYRNLAGDVVSRGIQDTRSFNLELSASNFTLNNTPGRFAISQDGLFAADVLASGALRVINMQTKMVATELLGSNINITNLAFTADSQELMFRDVTMGGIKSVGVSPDDQPGLNVSQTMMTATSTMGLRGLSVQGGSNRARFRVHKGPDALDQSFILTGDVRLHTLGISRTSVSSLILAQQALTLVNGATELVSLQRSIIGGEEQVLQFANTSLSQYSNNLSQADGLLRDTNIAEQTAVLAQQRLRNESAIALIAQANQIPRSVLSLIQK